jgi:hypothetical protein
VLTLSVEAGSRERARQIDAEAVVILMQKVAQRFRTVGASATVLDPAHVAEQTSPMLRRNLLITGLAGLIIGIATAAALFPVRRTASVSPDPRVERRLQERVTQVTHRERALAQRAGQLAAREKDLERREEELAVASSRPSPAEHAVMPQQQEQLAKRERELDRRAADLAAREVELEAQAAPPEREPEPIPEPVVANLPVGVGTWTLQELEERVRARSARYPQKVEEWETYLFLLREHADIDGTLPRSFDRLIGDVFSDVIVG